MSRKLLGALVAALSAIPLVAAADVDSRISYTSQPDQVAVFLNGVAYARDSLSLPGGVDARIILPDSTYVETLILREDGERVSPYRLDRRSGQLAVQWQSASQSALREVTLEYLLGGVSWTPKYDMWIGAETDETVDLDFFAQIENGALTMAEVETQLVAGRVDPGQMVDAVSQITANQSIAGYEEPVAMAAPTGSLDVQHVYDVGRVSAEPSDTVFLSMHGGTLPARRLHLWNAQTDDQVSVIYKVLNDSLLPFAEGTAHAYQGGLFIGSDFMELTPVGSEGSVTVGRLPDVRVSRSESSTAIDAGRYDYLNEVELTISNFGTTSVELEVVDQRRPEAQELQASVEPEETADNLLRWQVTVEPSSTVVISYDYKTE
jgi:hypothetical protein